MGLVESYEEAATTATDAPTPRRRWNTLDACIAVLLAAIVWAGVAALRIRSGRHLPVLLDGAIVPIELMVRFVGVDREVAGQIRVGDVESDRNGVVIARVVSVDQPEPQQLVVRFGDQDWVKRVPYASSRLVDLPARMQVLAEVRGDVLYYQGRLLGSGSSFIFQAPRYTIRGTVYDEGWVKVLVTTELLWPEEIVRLREGMEERGVDGRPLARILKIETVSMGPVLPMVRIDEDRAAQGLLRRPAGSRRRWRRVRTSRITVPAGPLPRPGPDVRWFRQHYYYANLWLNVRLIFYKGVPQYKGVVVRRLGPPIWLEFGRTPVQAQVTDVDLFKRVPLSSEVGQRWDGDQ